jgi:hypothetical protein
MPSASLTPARRPPRLHRRRAGLTTILSAFLLLALPAFHGLRAQTGTPAPSSAPVAPDAAQAAFTFDGFHLGDTFGSIATRAPYNDPCDIDPIEDGAFTGVVYGARPCRDRAFPEHTTVVLVLSRTEGLPDESQTILGLAWMGGGYFNERSDFPLDVGEPAARASEVLGPVVRSFPLERHGVTLLVQEHAGATPCGGLCPTTFSLVAGDTLVGFVVGFMPDDPGAERWGMIMQMYERYTAEAH